MRLDRCRDHHPPRLLPPRLLPPRLHRLQGWWSIHWSGEYAAARWTQVIRIAALRGLKRAGQY